MNPDLCHKISLVEAICVCPTPKEKSRHSFQHASRAPKPYASRVNDLKPTRQRADVFRNHPVRRIVKPKNLAVMALVATVYFVAAKIGLSLAFANVSVS